MTSEHPMNELAFRLLKQIEGSREKPIDPSIAREAVAALISMREVLEDMRLADIGGQLRIGVLADDGAASAEIGPLHRDVFRAWWARRQTALA